MDVYEAYRVAVDSGDISFLKDMFPKHWMVTGVKPSLTKKELAFAIKFPEAYEMNEVDDWIARAYVLSGKHSYEQLAVYVPTGVELRLEYEDYKMTHAWLIDGGLGVDVMHQIPFIKSIPSIQNPMKGGFVHGIIYGCETIASELQNINTSDLVPELKFMVCYLINSTINNMSASLETFRLLGFTVAMHVPVSITKWDVIKKSASLAIGSGAVGYECYKILVMHDDYRIVDKLQGRDINRWGFLAYIKHPRVLMEVKDVEWRTKLFERKVAVIPHVIFSCNDNVLMDIGGTGFIKSVKDGLYELRVNYAEMISGKYRVGDVMSVLIENQKCVGITREIVGKHASIIPSGCPQCGYMLDVYQDKLICTNPKCVEIIRYNISMWVNMYCPLIDDDVLNAFIKAYNIMSVADIYTTFDKGVVTEEKFVGLFKAMKNSRAMGLAKFMTLVCGKLTDVEAERMVAFAKMHIPAICGFTVGQLVEAVGMTSDKAMDVVEWIEINRVWFKYALEAFAGDKIGSSKLFGKTFIISGLLYERDKLSMEKQIREAGGRVIDNGKNVDYVIAGQFADERLLKRAQELSVPPIVIREASFKDFIRDCAIGA